MVASEIHRFVLSDKHLAFRVSATHIKSPEYQVIYANVSSTQLCDSDKFYISQLHLQINGSTSRC